MQLSEPIRKALAVAGGLLWMTISLFPLFGGAAKNAVRCAGREFTGEFDDCFNDYLPILEMLVPIIALGILWPFLRFAFTLWAPHPDARAGRWRLASSDSMKGHWPHLHVAALVFAGFCLWRAALYPIDWRTMPYMGKWIIFAIWAIAGTATAWPERDEF